MYSPNRTTKTKQDDLSEAIRMVNDFQREQKKASGPFKPIPGLPMSIKSLSDAVQHTDLPVNEAILEGLEQEIEGLRICENYTAADPLALQFQNLKLH